MKNKVLKVSMILIIIMTMTLSNFILVGKGFYSYAVEEKTTNHPNVEIETYFKNEKGEKVNAIEITPEEETFLYLRANVKKEGYFNGQVSLKEANFTIKESDSTYIQKIENGIIYFNQIQVGGTEEIKVKIKPIQEENYTINMLKQTSKLEIKGTYRDSTEKDINIQANRELKLNIAQKNTAENMINDLQVITNKIVTIEGKEKRMIQFAYKMGLQKNNYPIQTIHAKINLPEIEGKQAEIYHVDYLNSMKTLNYKYEKNTVDLILSNNLDNEGKALWKTEGNEKVILTCLYDKDVALEESEIKVQESMTLYDSTEIKTENTIVIGAEEKDSIIEIKANNQEKSIYKGKLLSGIERKYESITEIQINYAKAIQKIVVTENANQYGNVKYQKTKIKKEQVDEILGQNATINILDQNQQIVGTITNATKRDEQGNIVIDYTGKEVTSIVIETTAPEKEGTLTFYHEKAIKPDTTIIKEATELKNTVSVRYNEEAEKIVETAILLENTTTQARLEINKESLSTILANNVEIKAILVSNEEKYDLYKNPQIVIQLPEQVEKINLNSIDLLYENELKIKDYKVEGKTVVITLEGEQTQYKEEVIEGATLIINATIEVNRKIATTDTSINMTVTNEKGKTATVSNPIKIVAPTDVTTIHSMPELGIETLGQEENKQALVSRGQEAKKVKTDIEVINNHKETMEDIKILGNFPTNSNGNNMGINTVGEINLEGTEKATVYYSENAEATNEIDKKENKWETNITNPSKVSKYLIIVESLASQENIQATYSYEIPNNLEYNQTAKTGYQVKYTNGATKVENELKATTIEMQTGIGPKVEAKLKATMRGQDIQGPVKNGEVIKYQIAVSNTGSEDIANVVVKGNVPEGTTMVEPEEDYEYTGASYYKELENKTYEATIENLKVGEVAEKTYEVRVNKGVAEGTPLKNIAEITYGDVKKQSEEVKQVTEKGNLRITVKRVTDRQIDLYEAGTVQYFAIIENISEEKQENVKVETHLPEMLEVERLALITGMQKEEGEVYPIVADQEEAEIAEETETEGSQNIQTELLDYQKEVNIGTLESGEAKVLSYNMLIKKTDNKEKAINFSVTAKDNKKEYQSNTWEDEVKTTEIAMSMTAIPTEQYIKTGDIVTYTIQVENKSTAETVGLAIKDSIPKALSIKTIKVDEKVLETIEGNEIEIPLTIKANGTSTITIETVVNHSEARDNAESITNVAYAEIYGKKVATTSEINHIIVANETTEGNGGSNDLENNDIAKGNRTITGLAWFDENANGEKEQGEKLISDVTVKLLNTETNHLIKKEDGKILEAKTNENGVYVLDKIGNGNYIVIFDYDEAKYGLTKYKAEGVPEESNSNALRNELVVEGEKTTVASTDIVEINDTNVSNLNIGFIKLENFDLQLDKYVSKILIQNANGTTVREYENETMAKAELDAKQINGSTVIVEYQIKVSNKGEIEGYAKKIADYVPNDLKFSSELNKDWYQVGNTLYTEALANEKIKAGETKVVTLTLTKAMTENNTGLTQNTAEIVEDYNELGIPDSNSVPGNRAKEENDFGAADIVLSIRTGGAIYIATITIILVALGVVAVVILKNKNKEEKE